MGSKIDLLSKSELEYELKLRNFDPDVKSTSSCLRKKLRQLIRSQVGKDVKYLSHKLVMEDELGYIDTSLKVLSGRLEDLNDKSRPIDILRFEAKSEHLNLRITNLKNFSMTEEIKKTIEGYANELKALNLKFEEINKAVDTDAKAVVLRRLSESNIEEENLDEVFENVNLTESSKSVSDNREMSLNSKEQHASVIEHQNVTAILPNSEGAPSNLGNVKALETNLFSKLPNPILKYFENLQVCDGLKIDSLLKFLGVVLRLKAETNLSNSQILEMCQQYCRGPLRNKLLECKSTHKNLEFFHKEVLDCFVPLGLREALKRDLVTRPQHPNEPLHTYVCMVKENSKLLCCNYSEAELVHLICMNMNQEDRSRLVFMPRPVSLADLNQLCIQSQNVGYVNWERNNMQARGKMSHQMNKPILGPRTNKYVNNLNTKQESPIKCYNCQKLGHIARNCFKPKQYNSGRASERASGPLNG
jgi:hypothetical protein